MSFLSCKKHFVVESDIFNYKWQLRSSWKMWFFSQWTKDLTFLLWTWFICCVYVLQVFNDNGVIVEWRSNVCLVIKSLCVKCLVDVYMLWNFAFDGKGKWKVGDWLCRFYKSRTCDKREDLRRRFLDFWRWVVLKT